MTPLPFIVAEVSKNWRDSQSDTSLLLAQAFEAVINHNAARGYVLHSFTLHRLMTGSDSMNETIIAVFRHEP
jgi:hypothetical protein